MARPSKPLLIGRPLGPALDATFRRELQPMIKSVRATLPRVSTLADVRSLGAALKREWSDAKIRKIVVQTGTRGEKFSSRGWERFVIPSGRRRSANDGYVFVARHDARRPKVYDGEALLDRWTRETTSRITSLRDEISDGLRGDLITALERGTSVDDLRAKWLQKGIPVLWGTAEGRTKVIAHHQLSTLHAEVQRTRAESVGVTEFFWRTMGDLAVRDAHKALADRIYTYTDPKTGEGLPGTPVNCRCWAESRISAELLGSFGIRGSIAA